MLCVCVCGGGGGGGGGGLEFWTICIRHKKNVFQHCEKPNTSNQ